MSDMVDIKCAIEALDGFMNGDDLTPEKMELQRLVSVAGCFAAAAYEAAPSGGADVHALTRAFLLALIDPTSPELDYLRASPSSGAVAREASDHLSAIATIPSESPNG